MSTRGADRLASAETRAELVMDEPVGLGSEQGYGKLG